MYTIGDHHNSNIHFKFVYHYMKRSRQMCRDCIVKMTTSKWATQAIEEVACTARTAWRRSYNGIADIRARHDLSSF